VVGLMRCNAKIQLGHKRRESYCQLESGHSGKHSLSDLRCKAVEDGKRCSQPHGHFGEHTFPPHAWKPS